MKLPWKRRAEEAKQQAREAQRRLQETRERWPEVLAVAGETKHHGDLNGWTSAIKTIFTGN